MGRFAATGHNGQITDRQNNFMLKGDQFIGLLFLWVLNSLPLLSASQCIRYIIPFFSGAVNGQDFTELSWTHNWRSGLLILIIRENTESQFFDDQGRKQIRFFIT